MHYDQAMPFRQASLLALLFLPCLSVAQDRDLNNTIDNFKGMSGQLKDQVPGMNGASALGNLLRGKQKIDGAGQTEIKLSQEQQDYLDRQKKAKEKAAAKAASAKSKPAVKRSPVAIAAKAQPMIAQPAVIPTQPTIEFLNGEKLSNIAPGAQREVVLASLGKPRLLTKISGLDDGVHETLVYYLDSRHKASIRLIDGKVERIIR